VGGARIGNCWSRWGLGRVGVPWCHCKGGAGMQENAEESLLKVLFLVRSSLLTCVADPQAIAVATALRRPLQIGRGVHSW